MTGAGCVEDDRGISGGGCIAGAEGAGLEGAAGGEGSLRPGDAGDRQPAAALEWAGVAPHLPSRPPISFLKISIALTAGGSVLIPSVIPKSFTSSGAVSARLGRMATAATAVIPAPIINPMSMSFIAELSMGRPQVRNSLRDLSKERIAVRPLA